MDLTLTICMYNAEQYIEKTLCSILSQTKQDFQLLIVDDCSTDNSVECVEHFFQEHPRQYVLKLLNENQGIAYARNYALNVAVTKFMVFVDADDLPLPTLLEKEYALLTSDQDLMAVSSWSEFIDKQGCRIKGGLYIGETDKESFKKRAEQGKRIFLPIQTMFDRSCAIRVGGFCCTGFPKGRPRYQDFCEDLDLWTRMSDLYTEGKAIVSIPEVLYQYRKGDGLSSNHFNMIIKMQYTKQNVRRRRMGLPNLTFSEYYASLSEDDLKTLKRDSMAADALKNGVFNLKQGNINKGVWNILSSIWYKPSYIIQKLNANF